MSNGHLKFSEQDSSLVWNLRDIGQPSFSWSYSWEAVFFMAHNGWFLEIASIKVGWSETLDSFKFSFPSWKISQNWSSSFWLMSSGYWTTSDSHAPLFYSKYLLCLNCFFHGIYIIFLFIWINFLDSSLRFRCSPCVNDELCFMLYFCEWIAVVVQQKSWYEIWKRNWIKIQTFTCFQQHKTSWGLCLDWRGHPICPQYKWAKWVILESWTLTQDWLPPSSYYQNANTGTQTHFC